MKKVFPLQLPDQSDDRVREGIKHELRKYVKRERRKPLPDGFTHWELRCKVGAERDTAPACAWTDVPRLVDECSGAGAEAVYVEILAEPARRVALNRSLTGPSADVSA